MTILYRSPFIPREWIAAHGLEPLRLVPDGRAVPPGPVPEVEGVCPFLRAFVNEACHADGATALVLTTFCDQVRHACAVAQNECELPVHLFNLPASWQTPASQKLYAAELERLSRFLVEHGGTRPTTETLRQTMLATTHPPTEPAVFCIPHQTRIPIALLGGPLQGKDAVLLDWITAGGAFVALDGSEYGERTRPAAFDRRRTREDPFDELCHAYFGSIPDAFRRPNSALYAWVGQKVREREVRGVLIVRYVWCDTWHAEVRRLQEWLSVPCIDLDFTADAPGARTRTRIEAFLESLQ